MLYKRKYWKEIVKKEKITSKLLEEFNEDLLVYKERLPNWNERQAM